MLLPLAFYINLSIVNSKPIIYWYYNMQLVPILEIRHGKCVHTEQKNSLVNYVVAEDPIATVQGWVEKGVKRIHFVDVDAIETGEPVNVDLLSRIKQQSPGLSIQVIGGIKCVDSAFIWMDAGADFLILNGKSVRQKNLLADICVEFPGKIIVEIDSRHGAIGLGDTEQLSQFSAFAKQLEDDGVAGLVVTEVPTEGHVNTTNLLNVNQLSKDVGIPIFANGGIDEIADLEILLADKAEKLTGIIIGKVIHRADFCLNRAHQLLDEYQVAC